MGFHACGTSPDQAKFMLNMGNAHNGAAAGVQREYCDGDMCRPPSPPRRPRELLFPWRRQRALTLVVTLSVGPTESAHHEAESKGVEGAIGGIVQVLRLGPQLHKAQKLAEARVCVAQQPDNSRLEDGAGAAHGHIAVLSCQPHRWPSLMSSGVVPGEHNSEKGGQDSNINCQRVSWVISTIRNEKKVGTQWSHVK